MNSIFKIYALRNVSYLETLIRFFNPRIDIWEAHFAVEDGMLQAKTPQRQVMMLIFQFNSAERILYRKKLIESALY